MLDLIAECLNLRAAVVSFHEVVLHGDAKGFAAENHCDVSLGFGVGVNCW